MVTTCRLCAYCRTELSNQASARPTVNRQLLAGIRSLERKRPASMTGANRSLGPLWLAANSEWSMLQ